MNTIFPDLPGLSGKLLKGWRRRPGSPVSADNTEEVFAIIVKQAYDITPHADPAQGTLTPRDGGHPVFEADFPENSLQNVDFSEGGTHWSTLGGAEAVFGDGAVDLVAHGGQGTLRQVVNTGRQLRDRRIGIVAKHEAAAGLNAPRPQLVVSGAEVAIADAEVFADKPLFLGAGDVVGSGSTSQSLTANFPTLEVDDETVTLSDLVVTAPDFESDLVPFKPEADIIVVADAPPMPLTLSVNGTTRFSQAGGMLRLTGLGWEDKGEDPRKGQAGDVENMTQQLADDFDNLFYNGYRRAARQPVAQGYLAPGDRITLAREGVVDGYGFTLPAAHPRLRHKWFGGSGQDDPCLWFSRDVPLRLDTLVIEPDRDLAYAVWRACWALDDGLGGQGPIAPDQNREAEVTMEGAA